jgi:hypothetical protein
MPQRELVTIGDLRTVGPAVRSRARRLSYLNVVPMRGIGQTNLSFVPGANSTTGGSELQDAGVALLNYLDSNGVPSEHTNDPNVVAFQTAWNADPANAGSNHQLSVDGGYGPNVHDALAAMVGAVAPPVNTGTAPVPSTPGGTSPATPGAPPLPLQASAAGGGSLLLWLAIAAAGAYLVFGGKKRTTSVIVRKNPRRGRRRRGLV